MRPKVDDRVRAAAAAAGRQHGNVTVGQLLDLGWTRSMVKRWHAKGLLHREFRGVYRFGHRAPSVEARYLAAVLACGEGALLSGGPAAWVLGVLKGRPPAPEVSAPAHRRVPGVRTRRRSDLVATSRRGIPITTLPQTLTDLARMLSLDDLATACHHAEVLHGTKPPPPTPGTPGGWKLDLIASGDAPALLSRMERLFRRRLGDHDLPLPDEVNRRRGAHYLDCHWRRQKVTVELDSYRFHHSRHAWEQDRQRERDARARGETHRRYTWRDVAEEPAPMVADLANLLRFPAVLQPPGAPDPAGTLDSART